MNALTLARVQQMHRETTLEELRDACEIWIDNATGIDAAPPDVLHVTTEILEHFAPVYLPAHPNACSCWSCALDAAL